MSVAGWSNPSHTSKGVRRTEFAGPHRRTEQSQVLTDLYGDIRICGKPGVQCHAHSTPSLSCDKFSTAPLYQPFPAETLPPSADSTRVSHARGTMEKSVASTVKDVSSHEFVRAYAAHLKRTGKVRPYSTQTASTDHVLF